MQDDPKEQARRDAADAIRYAQTLMEIVPRLIADMQQAGVLRPSTRSEIQLILREGYDPQRCAQALRRLEERMRTAGFQDQEMKRETPERKG
jgi:hypothetical protein